MRETHRFDPERAKRLDDPWRRETVDPEGLLRSFGVAEGAIGVDLGCGTGFFTIPLASLVGKSGKVYAVDTSKEMLGYLESKSPPDNIEMVAADIAGTGFPDEFADLCVVGFVIHEHETPEKVAAEIYRFLKPGGRVLVVDWQKKDDTPGPPPSERLSKDEVMSLLQAAGFVDCRLAVDGEFHYAVAAEKDSSSSIR